MITMQEQITIDNINATTKTLSINKLNIILNDGIEISRTNPVTYAYAPGQIDAVKAFTGWDDSTPEIIYLNSIWTQEVIDAYQALLAQNNQL